MNALPKAWMPMVLLLAALTAWAIAPDDRIQLGRPDWSGTHLETTLPAMPPLYGYQPVLRFRANRKCTLRIRVDGRALSRLDPDGVPRLRTPSAGRWSEDGRLDISGAGLVEVSLAGAPKPQARAMCCTAGAPARRAEWKR